MDRTSLEKRQQELNTEYNQLQTRLRQLEGAWAELDRLKNLVEGNNTVVTDKEQNGEQHTAIRSK